MAVRLDRGACEAALAGLEDWTFSHEPDRLGKVFKFADFSSAFAFMARVALLAEKQDHHPDWSNSYNTVSITLSTHSVGGLSEKDFVLARAIDTLA